MCIIKAIKNNRQKKLEFKMKQKYGFILYSDGSVYYTSGLEEKYGIPELEIKAPWISQEAAFDIITYYAEILHNNKKILRDNLSIVDYLDMRTYFRMSSTPRKKDSFRIIFPDSYNHFPWESDCELKYKSGLPMIPLIISSYWIHVKRLIQISINYNTPVVF